MKSTTNTTPAPKTNSTTTTCSKGTPWVSLVPSAHSSPDLGRHGFSIHMLDEKNTVTTAIMSITPDKENCELRVKKTNKILRKAKSLYLGHRSGPLSSEPRVEDKESSYTFPHQGTFYSNGRILQIGVIVNDRGECYNPMATGEEPCLEYPFPLEKHEQELKKRQK